MSSHKRSSRRLKSLFTITADCGGCSRQRSDAAADPAQPKPRPKTHPPLFPTEPQPHCHPFETTSSAISSSVAIEKDSDDPYNDFRQSMLQMIFQKEMYSRDDLQELLNCFLKMNSADHHDVIVRAFTEIMSHDGPICVSSRQISEKP
uniref:Transcription repressor n=1 Tax=Kalanchoe fedtschenkoi TaxID=63787 RepID=A0A7N0RI76_KALFE